MAPASRLSAFTRRVTDQVANGPSSSVTILTSVTAMSVVTTSPVFFMGAFGAQITKDLRIGPAALGALAAVFFATTGLSATHLGRLADRLGGRTAGRWAILASAGSLALAGVGSTYWTLVAAMALGGFGNGLGGPTANMIVADRVQPRSMGAAFGVKQSAVPAATLLGGLAVPLFVNSWGWRPTMVGAALLSVVALVPVPHASSRPQTGNLPTVRPGLDRTTIAVGAAFLFGIAAATSLSTLLSTYSVAAGFSATFAGLTLSAGSLGAIVVRIASGRAADRGKVDAARLSAWMMWIGAIGLLAVSIQSRPTIALGGFVAYAIGWGWSGLLVLNLVRAHPGAPGSATGVVLTGAAIGGMLGPASIGWLAESSGYSTAWVATACLSAFGAVAARVSGRFTAEALEDC